MEGLIFDQSQTRPYKKQHREVKPLPERVFRLIKRKRSAIWMQASYQQNQCKFSLQQGRSRRWQGPVKSGWSDGCSTAGEHYQMSATAHRWIEFSSTMIGTGTNTLAALSKSWGSSMNSTGSWVNLYLGRGEHHQLLHSAVANNWNKLLLHCFAQKRKGS